MLFMVAAGPVRFSVMDRNNLLTEVKRPQLWPEEGRFWRETEACLLLKRQAVGEAKITGERERPSKKTPRFEVPVKGFMFH